MPMPMADPAGTVLVMAVVAWVMSMARPSPSPGGTVIHTKGEVTRFQPATTDRPTSSVQVMAVMAAHTSAREMSLSRYQKMTTISTRAMTIRAAILAGEDRLAVPSVACSVIARSSGRHPSAQASASRPLAARGSYRGGGGPRRTGDVAGIAREVASRHGALDTSGPVPAGTPVPLGSAVHPGGGHHHGRPVRPVHGQGDPRPDPDRPVHRGQPRPGGAAAGQAGGGAGRGGGPGPPGRLRPG